MDKTRTKAVRGGHRSAVTKLINRTDDKIEENEITDRELSATIENLQKKGDLLQNLDSKLLDITDIDDLENEIVESDEYSLQLDTTIRRYQDLIA